MFRWAIISFIKQNNTDVAWSHIQPNRQGNKESGGGGQGSLTEFEKAGKQYSSGLFIK